MLFKLPRLDPTNPLADFPPPERACTEPNGLLAFGGDLSIPRLLNAYRHGIFPWFSPDEPILWWSPDPRCLFVPGSVHVSHSLAKKRRGQHYAVSFDRDFSAVIAACSASRSKQQGTWISLEMQTAYEALHRAGHAHSVEVWQSGALVGGLYGVAVGQAFFGESMFSRVADASKLALLHLSDQLKAWSFSLLDCQVVSPHLLSMGAQALPRRQFIEQLKPAVAAPAHPHWRFDPELAGNPQHQP